MRIDAEFPLNTQRLGLGGLFRIKFEMLRVNQDHRSASSLRQRIDHPHPQVGPESRVVNHALVPSAAARTLSGQRVPLRTFCWQADGWPGRLFVRPGS